MKIDAPKVQLAQTPSDLDHNGLTSSLTAAQTTAQFDVGYINSTGKVALADADAAATAGAIVIATAAIATDVAGVYLVHGIIRNDAWTWTPGGILYLSTTAGGMTQTAPSGTGDIVQILGVALTADIAYWNPDLVTVEIV